MTVIWTSVDLSYCQRVTAGVTDTGCDIEEPIQNAEPVVGSRTPMPLALSTAYISVVSLTLAIIRFRNVCLRREYNMF